MGWMEGMPLFAESFDLNHGGSDFQERGVRQTQGTHALDNGFVDLEPSPRPPPTAAERSLALRPAFGVA